ncbi:MAG TPA: methyltransferase domain-containing protein [Tepidisphaeraceae bacterium]|jgi:SAM-dependent methyltransferase
MSVTNASSAGTFEGHRDAQPDADVLKSLHGQVFGDCNAAIGSLLVFMGDKLNLFRTLAQAGPLTSADLAQRVGANERMLREWLCAMAAAGYVGYESRSERFGLSPEQAIVFAGEGHPAFMQGPIDLIYSLFQDEPALRDAFHHGRGLQWGDHNACLFCATERFFGPLYRTSLLQEWLPAIPGLVEKLTAGADVADVGCGLGTSALLMADAFPASRFVGFDSHGKSIEAAGEAAHAAGLNGRVRFERASAKEFAGQYDVICYFDALHDMGDPVGAATHARARLKPGGVVMLVEPYAEDRLEDNLTSERAAVSRFFYAASTLACVPGSQAQEGRLVLGAQAGRRRLQAVLEEAGFDKVRVATATAANLVLEARA